MNKVIIEVRGSTVAAALLLAVLAVSGVALATVAGSVTRFDNNALEVQGSSGNDGVAFKTNGLRLHVGSGSTDYLDGDGTYVRSLGPLVFPSGGATSIYGPLMCDSFNVRVGADCAGGNANRLNLYSGAGVLQWTVDTNGVLAPAGATQVASLPNQTHTCGLDGGSPGQCDVTITSGAKCWSGTEGNTQADATAGNAISYPVATVARITAGNGHTNTVDVFCNK